MKTLKNALKMRCLAKENENPLINWKMSVNAAWYDFTSDEARLMYATGKWSRYIENIAYRFLGVVNLRRTKRFTGNPKAIWIGDRQI